MFYKKFIQKIFLKRKTLLFFFAVSTAFFSLEFFAFNSISSPSFVFFAFSSCILFSFFFVFKSGLMPRISRNFLIGFLWVVIVFSVFRIIVEVLSVPFFDWNASRLAWPLSIKYGYHFYYEANEGPILARMYGPITVFAYLPCSIFRTPTPALCFGSFLSLLYFSFPAWLLIIKKAYREKYKKETILYAFCMLHSLVFLLVPLRLAFFNIHADAPALGLSGLACALLYFRQDSEDVRTLAVSAFLIACSVWTKQLMAPLLIAVPIYILIADGKKAFRRFVLFLAIFLAGLLVIFLFSFNAKALIFEMFFIPSHQFFQLGSMKSIGLMSFFLLYFLTAAVLLVMLLVVNFKKIYEAYEQKIGILSFVRKNRWMMFIFIGVSMIPVAFLGILKVSGDRNNESFYLYFFMLAVIVSLMEAIKGFRQTITSERDFKFIRLSLILVLLVVIRFSLMGFSARAQQVTSFLNNPQELAYLVAKKYPEIIYFPEHVLSTLLADGKLYHSSDGLLDRGTAKLDIYPKDFYLYVPEKIKLIVASRNNPLRRFLALRGFPDFNKEIFIKEIPWARVYLRGE